MLLINYPIKKIKNFNGLEYLLEPSAKLWHCYFFHSLLRCIYSHVFIVFCLFSVGNIRSDPSYIANVDCTPEYVEIKPSIWVWYGPIKPVWLWNQTRSSIETCVVYSNTPDSSSHENLKFLLLNWMEIKHRYINELGNLEV